VTSAAWELLVAVALVGTERKPVSAEGITALGALVDLPIEQASEEATVLTAAGVVASYRRTGFLPTRGQRSEQEPAPTDDRPEASAAASQILELLLDGHIKVPGGAAVLAAEWLGRCADRGRRPPARVLPALLDHGTRSRELRGPIVAAGGPRLAWLAGHNPNWAWAAATVTATEEEDANEVWRTGDHAARMARLIALRSSDPAAAIELVQESWAGEKARDRAEILDVLRAGLGSADEALLEQGLDDRAPTVRGAAADLLASLPSSALAQRMTDRVRPLVVLDGRRRRQQLNVELPDEPDDQARRDGIQDQGAPRGIGQRTWWLMQLVGATPLGFWTDELGLTPAQALRSAAARPELRDGWTIAARRQRNGEWARELVADRPEPALLRALPPEDAWPAAEAALRKCTDGAVPGLLSAAAGAATTPWPTSLSAAAVARLRANKNSIATEQGLTVVAAAADPSVGPELERWLGSLGPQDRLRHQLRTVVHALSIRHTIAQEFA
jgi:hypothetical protein